MKILGKHVVAIQKSGEKNYKICVINLELKNKLTKAGITFASQTDTEVVPNLLAYYLSIELKRVKGEYANIDFENNVLKKAIADLEGTWALVILFKHTPNKLYLCKNLLNAFLNTPKPTHLVNVL